MFYAGTVYAALQANNTPAPFVGSGEVSLAGLRVVGTITSISGDTLQVRTAQDFTLVTLSEATGISKTVPAAAADLRVGD